MSETSQNDPKSTDASSCNRPCCSATETSPSTSQSTLSISSLPSPASIDALVNIPVIGERAPATAAEAQAQAHAAFLAVSRGFNCQWEGCMMSFLSQQELLSHIVTHAAAPLAPRSSASPIVVVAQQQTSSRPLSSNSLNVTATSPVPATATVVTDKPEEIVPLLLQNQAVTTSQGPVSVSAPTVVVTTCSNPSHHLPQVPVPVGTICNEAHPHVHHEHENHGHSHSHSHAHPHAHHDDDRHSSDSGEAPTSSSHRKKTNTNSKKRKGSTIDEVDMNLGDEDRKFPCDTAGCEKVFKRSGHLKRHKLIHQPRDARQRFHCSQDGCAKNYSTKYDLAAHIRQVHMGMLLYKCSVRGCCRRFVRQDSLVKHLTTFDHSKTHAASHREEGEFTGELDLNDVLQAAQIQMQMVEMQQQQQQLQQQQAQQQQQQSAGLGLVPVNIFNPFSSSGSSEFLSAMTTVLTSGSSDALDASTVQDMRTYANLFSTPQ